MKISLNLGRTQTGTGIVLRDAENPHAAISGRSGSGKSYFLKKLAQQAAQQEAVCIALDYSGDFCTYTPPNGIYFQRMEVTSPSFSLNPLLMGTELNADIRAQQLLSLLHSVFRMGAKATLALRHVTQEYLRKDRMPTLDGLLTYAQEISQASVGLAAALEPLALLASLIQSGNVPISLDLACPGLTVLDFSRVIDPEMRKFLVELILCTIWNCRTSAPSTQATPVILILDEAQNLAWGQGSMSIRILREGRKYNLAGWFSSQWVGNKEAASALGQAALQAHFRPDDQNARQLAKFFYQAGDASLAEYQRLVSSLQRGQFLWRSSRGAAIKVCVGQ